jgi:hypothetical protein
MEARSSWLAIVARHRDGALGVEEAVFERKGYWRRLLDSLCPKMMFGSVTDVITMAQWRTPLLVTAVCTPCTRQDRVGTNKPCVQLVCSCRAIGHVEGKKTAC